MCVDDLPDREQSLPDDEIVAEVRAIRHGLFAAAGFDLDRLFAQLKTREAEERAKGRIFVTPGSLSSSADAAA